MVYTATKYTDFALLFLIFKIWYDITVSRKCDLIYSLKKNTAFPGPVFTKITNNQYNDAQISLHAWIFRTEIN